MAEMFTDDDQGYLDWLERHPAGFVVNTFRIPNPSYVILHVTDRCCRATCGTITGTPARGELHPCRLCRP